MSDVTVVRLSCYPPGGGPVHQATGRIRDDHGNRVVVIVDDGYDWPEFPEMIRVTLDGYDYFAWPGPIQEPREVIAWRLPFTRADRQDPGDV
ncbi:hypothetical protein [Algiphilus sp.]|uniref:hypothetical protein n=1 Tax=Algiphilus sp. TaxID=1872431 RepID=UPI0025B7FE54|nr:hypothetical protein [Algiphilus sp.]MCK5770947.1 hypothetical protein [Algiphilus sp.]